jgi:HK97 family phage prohead protease
MSSAPLFSLGPIDQLADDEIVGIAISGALGRDGNVWVVLGIDLENYRKNPVVLRGHDADCVVGSAVAIGPISSNEIGVRIKFAPPGVSAIADETRGLVKAGVLKGISAGVDPQEVEPLDPRDPRGGLRLLRAELLELSVVAIPADVNARVTARSLASRPGGAAMLRSLPSISAGAIEHAFSCVGRVHAPQKPIGLLSDYERARFYAEAQRQRTLAVSALQLAERARERDYSYAQRQADLASLRRLDDVTAGREFAKPRLRPYGG